MKRNILLEKSMKSLEWPALLAELGKNARSAAGGELCANLSPEVSEERVETLQSKTAEMVDLLKKDEAPVIPPLSDMRTEISLSGKNIVLDPPALLKISSTVKAAENLILFFNTASARNYPLLTELAARLPDTVEVRKEIERAVDDLGNIKERASRELGNLYAEKRKVRDAVTARLEPYLTAGQFSASLREQYFTIREERYVIPVKSEMQKSVDGIIHDSSKSGMTLFVEPRELIPLNNRLRLLDLKIGKEVRKILSRLSSSVKKKAEDLILNIEILAYFDLLQAKAELALQMNAEKPEISHDGEIDIKDGYHPLLRLRPGRAVSNSVYLAGGGQVLVISGPNTGGKTVLLKSLGLLSLMMRAGLHIPVGKGSRLPVFRDIYADIGDEQNISGSLSTFAGHLKNVSAMMDNLSSSSLVLLDEFMSSTDPAEGCALAEAVLDDFARKGSTAVVTTHFSSLKFMATEKELFLNGSMEIDPDTLLPTYKLIQGIPGRSHAIDIARRLGMNNSVLLKAEKSISDDSRSIEKLLKALSAERKELQEEKDRVSEIKEEALVLREETEKIRESLKQRELSFKRERAATLKKEIGEARAEILKVVRGVNTKKTEHSAKDAVRKLKDIESSVEAPLDIKGCLPLFKFNEGDQIYIPALKITGTLQSGPSRKNLQKICTDRAEITLDARSTYGRKLEKTTVERRPSLSRVTVVRNSAGSGFKKCSLRGLSQESAIEKLTDFLDKAIQREVYSVTIVHGHGTGKLKKSVREYLRNSPYSNSFSPGLSTEGGDGVTVVKLNSA